MITDYCQTADDLPMLVTDTLSKLVELLKVCLWKCYIFIVHMYSCIVL